MNNPSRDSRPRADAARYFIEAEDRFRDQFEIERLVTATDNRVLFVGRDYLLKRRVALRVHLEADTRSRAWFERELELMANLDHPSLRTIYAAGVAGDWAYHISQWIEGESLEDSMQRGPRSIPAVLRLARDLSEAIEYCHSEDIYIRRLIPTTVMIDRQKRAVITDLRFANAVLAVAGPDGEGATPFLAPETRGNNPGEPASDIYAIGAILYYAITGTPPDEDPGHIVPPAEIRPACPAFANRVVMRALSPNIGARYMNGSELVDDITAAIGEFDFHEPDPQSASGAETDGNRDARLRRALGDDYELLDELGSGGFGRVYRVRDLRLERQVALKVLHPHLAADPEVVERFQREAQLAARLTHPNIVNIYDIDGRLGFIWYTMVYVRGPSLAKLVRVSGPQPIDLVLRFLRQSLGALQHAHENHVVHRDLKPENILMSEVDGSVQIADFGLALALRETGNFGGATSRSGTPEFAAPEQMLGEQVDERSDLYSLALVAMFAILGRPPFSGSTPEAIIAQQAVGHLPDISEVRRDVPNRLIEILTRAASREPADRFRNASEFRDALQTMRRASDTIRVPWYKNVFKRRL